MKDVNDIYILKHCNKADKTRIFVITGVFKTLSGAIDCITEVDEFDHIVDGYDFSVPTASTRVYQSWD